MASVLLGPVSSLRSSSNKKCSSSFRKQTHAHLYSQPRLPFGPLAALQSPQHSSSASENRQHSKGHPLGGRGGAPDSSLDESWTDISDNDSNGRVPNPVRSLPDDNNENGSDGQSFAAAGAGVGALVGLALVLGGTIALSSYYREDINDALDHFTEMLATQGHLLSLVEYSTLYVVLEMFAVPAIPLTMSAGALFGLPVGLAAASFSSTLAACAAFLVARYLARDRVVDMIKGNKKLEAVDEAVSKDGFRVVTLLRLSPLLPFALSNYAYGVSSVPLGEYALGSWLGMMPGTLWFVAAGNIGRNVMSDGMSADAGAGALALAAGFGVSILSGSYVARLVSEATGSVDDEDTSK